MRSPRDIGPVLRMMRHVPPRKLARRVWLQAKRRVRVGLEKVPGGGPRPNVLARPRTEPWPAPIFPPRTHLATDSHFMLLGVATPLRPTVDWTPDEHPPGTLGRIVLHEHRWLEALDDPTFSAVLTDWCERVQPYGDQYWIDAYNAFALAVRVVVWMQELARRSDLDPDLREQLARRIAEQLGFLARNLETDLGGNHLIKDLKALLWGAACFEGPDARAWYDLAGPLLQRELTLQVPDDGLHSELSPAYHLQVFADLIEVHTVVPDGPLRAQLTAALNRMAVATLFTTGPDGTPILLNDGGLHMAYPAAQLLELWTDRGGEASIPDGAFGLADAGLYGHRTADGDLLVVDAGPLGMDALPSHGHADALSLLWWLDGQPVLVDPGVYEYQGPTRAECRSTRAHNTVCIDDQDQAELFGVFRAGRRWTPTVHAWHPRPDGLLISASHDGYDALEGSPTHRRTVELAGRALTVRDRIDGGAGQPVVATLLLHPEVRVEQGDESLYLHAGALRLSLHTTAQVTLEEASWYPDFGRRHPTVRLVLHYGRAPCRCEFTLQPAPPIR